ncbi:hypothetical protein ClosIBUN22A_CONTIG155g03237 [Clostridium sp. IBUN22A]|nr:hypothetical protein ClosIBUN22A_CONTIG155g03237 [Clostridium sp. IBUN22A]
MYAITMASNKGFSRLMIEKITDKTFPKIFFILKSSKNTMYMAIYGYSCNTYVNCIFKKFLIKFNLHYFISFSSFKYNYNLY